METQPEAQPKAVDSVQVPEIKPPLREVLNQLKVDPGPPPLKPHNMTQAPQPIVNAVSGLPKLPETALEQLQGVSSTIAPLETDVKPAAVPTLQIFDLRCKKCGTSFKSSNPRKHFCSSARCSKERAQAIRRARTARIYHRANQQALNAYRQKRREARRYMIAHLETTCELCQKKVPIVLADVDHRDRNPMNDNPDNFRWLCHCCNQQEKVRLIKEQSEQEMKEDINTF